MVKQNTFKRIMAGCLSFVIALSLIFSNLSTPASAIEVDAGSSPGSGGGSTILNGLAVYSTTVEDNCVGYRVSVIEADGSTKGDVVVDLMKKSKSSNKTTFGAKYSYISGQKNKMEWIKNMSASIKSK